eukprot:CAMPEP_0171162652 /NCGR_PEP_ID=MMETSP0790-20130122/4704_1 /TAXON_ID=2925 /ORGANISM="Alexandrium catenella, Strain OF101" /LENGTH=66 /DNA_ID=CAMNT_0011627265 /DNA_START=36 /DNA_END=236 /DNA_ORIENTATION=+
MESTAGHASHIARGVLVQPGAAHASHLWRGRAHVRLGKDYQVARAPPSASHASRRGGTMPTRLHNI